MKHSPIIQENLDKLTHPKDKLRYLFYAYKEIIIGIAIFLVFAISITTSILFKNEADLTLRIVSDVPLATETMDGLKSQLSEKLSPNTKIDMNNFYSTDQLNVLMVQLAAQEIDYIVLPENLSDETYQLQIENVQQPAAFELTQDDLPYTFYKPFNKNENAFAKELESAFGSD